MAIALGLTLREVENAILDLYDAHVGIYGYDKNIFRIATRGQVALYLSVSAPTIDKVYQSDTRWGITRVYTVWKNRVLAENGRGSIIGDPRDYYSSFIPNEDSERCDSSVTVGPVEDY